jgi:hypothetical protein
MRKRGVFLSLIAALLGMSFLFADSDTATQVVVMKVAEICVVDVSGSPELLMVSAPASGGENPQESSDSSTSVLYTSTVAAGTTRAITAAWGSSDSAPSGCVLKLRATPSGQTNEGNPAGEIQLSTTPQAIVLSIGSCATGNGDSSGAKLTYTLSAATVADLLHGESTSATVVLTLTDAS